MAVVVTEVLPNGYLVISGSQEIRVNAEVRVLQLAGIVNPLDISRRNDVAYDKIAEAQGALSRQQSQLVTAPRPGIVHRLSGNQGGEIVSAGDAMVVLVPEATQRSVEIVIDGNDAPLVRLDAKVMIQFEGWPVVQFPGAPELMYGVFEGRVALIDPPDDGMGQFRTLVVPAVGERWPEPRFLRQGVRAKAWVLLNEVPLGKELWRQLNGFPPVLQTEDPKDNVARKRIK